MSLFYKAAGWGSILALIAVVIAFVKQLMAFLGLLAFAIKAAIVLAFVVVFLVVGFAVIRSARKNPKQKTP